MQLTDIKKDGTTTVEFTDAEAHAIRDALAATSGGDSAAWTLQRLLSHAHGDTEK
ncbi:hypothetical protein AB0G60_02410 [Streptomyces angustmyceticus]|uniref:Uncharacterized protein n=1 Tax=Streptomyces angustmyceticus TaxID=285578 RepID=A0A5J4L9I3_9ACTN|nr:hypothetical protein [Streptomyces angustmyceticus]UAL65515.1 hypothetical protein K7396_02385 [Streptomyces angustmyceticus]GES27966.1 hypothetical protein San01_04530 [Streptomyces angustmyceticus]